MKRRIIATRGDLDGYLRRLAWTRYHLVYQGDRARADDAMTPAQVRAAMAQAENRLRWAHCQRQGAVAGEGAGRSGPLHL